MLETETKRILPSRSAKKRHLWGSFADKDEKPHTCDNPCTSDEPTTSEASNLEATEEKTKTEKNRPQGTKSGVITIAKEFSSDPVDPTVSFHQDPKVLRVIELLRYRKVVAEYQDKLENDLDEHKAEKIPLPPLPETVFPKPTLISKLPKNFNDEWCHAALRKSVATLGSFVGFESGDSEALEYMTDLAGQGFVKMAQSLKTIVEKRALGEECGGTKHPVSHLMQIEGVGKIADLRDSYNRRFVEYPSKVESEVKKMAEIYAKTLDSAFEMPDIKRRKLD